MAVQLYTTYTVYTYQAQRQIQGKGEKKPGKQIQTAVLS